MIYNIKKLLPTELEKFYHFIQLYKNYDKIDLLIEMVIDNKEEVLSRIIEEKIEKEIFINNLPDELKYCDGAHCEIDYSQSEH